jgi:xylan 1,4-beta-xylosidase
LEIARDSSIRGAKEDISALASKGEKTAGVMLWNYHDDDLPAKGTMVNVQIKGIKEKKILITHYRIDKEHSNSYEAWKKMGSPQKPTQQQIEELEKAGQLELLTSPFWKTTKNGEVSIQTELPRQGVSFLKLDW